MKVPYDATISWAVNDSVCNFACDYCFFEHSTERLPTLDSRPLVETLGRTGLRFKVVIIGAGEPFMAPGLVDACESLSRSHYLQVISNLSSPLVADFARRIDPSRVVKIIASAHLKELEKRGLLERYIANYLELELRGFPISSVAVGFPPLALEADAWRRRFAERGIRLEFEPFMGIWEGRSYPDDYTEVERESLGLGSHEAFQVAHRRGGLPCIAGHSAGIVSASGEIYPCFLIHESLGRLAERRLEFSPELTLCPFETCLCPVNAFEPELYEAALRERVPAVP